MSVCNKKEEYIQRLEPDAKKYQDQRDTEFNQLKEDVKILKAKQAESEYKDKHSSMLPLKSKIHKLSGPYGPYSVKLHSFRIRSLRLEKNALLSAV